MNVLLDIWNAILRFLPRLLFTCLVLIVGFLAIKVFLYILKKWMNKRLDISFHVFVGSCVKIVLFILLFLCAAGTLGLDTTSFITALGSAGLAIGLALQASLSNLASGMVILASKNYEVGDHIETEGFSGIIKKIDLMFTIVNTFDNTEISIPNSKLTSNIVINYTKNDLRRVDLLYSISYESSIEKAKEILYRLGENSPFVLKDPEPRVIVKMHGDSAIILQARFWCRKEDYWEIVYTMNEQVKAAFDEEEIAIPFPQLDIHTK